MEDRMGESLQDVLARYIGRLKDWEEAKAKDARLREVFPIKEMMSDAVASVHHTGLHGHVSTAHLFELAEERTFRHFRDFHGIDVVDLHRRHGLGWLVTSQRGAFLRPVRPMEPLTFLTRVIDFSVDTLRIETVVIGARQSLKAVLWHDYGFREIRTGRKIPHSEDLAIWFPKVKVSFPPEHGDFQVRCEAIVAELKR
jgi:acyl-CoA thioesterase FadM